MQVLVTFSRFGRRKNYIILFQSRVGRHVCDVINLIINVIFSNLLITVSYSLRFSENMLNMS